MYGNDVETLNVYTVQDGQSLPSTPSWSTAGNQGNYWHRATIDIAYVNVGFRVSVGNRYGILSSSLSYIIY